MGKRRAAATVVVGVLLLQWTESEGIDSEDR